MLNPLQQVHLLREIMSHQRLQFMLDDALQLCVLLAGKKYPIQVVPHHMGGVLPQDFDDNADSDDGLLLEGIPSSHRDQGVQIDLVDKGIALQDRADEDSHAAEVLVVPASKQILDIP
jgi:hypothetical protein